MARWDDETLTAVSKVDAAHQIINNLFKRLHEARSDDTCAAFIGTIISELVDAFVDEIGIEETAMIVNHYPQYDEHHREHDGLLEYLNDLLLDFEKNKSENIPMKIKLIWYAKNVHVTIHDRPLCEFLKIQHHQSVFGYGQSI